MTALPVDDILDSLDLSRAEPGIGFLQALFVRFNARVPFETASKILRDAEVDDPAEKPRWPEVFWPEHLASGAGGTCFARVAAFAELLESLGFATRKVLGRVVSDNDHAALLVRSGAQEWICDVGFPLPGMFVLPDGEPPTPDRGASETLEVERTPRGLAAAFPAFPGEPRRLELFLPAVPEEEFRTRWRRTFRPESKFLRHVGLRKRLENRSVAFASGELRVDDEHSRLTVPLAPPRAVRLEEIFGVDADLLSRAFERVGDPDSTNRASLVAFLETDASPVDAFAAIADRAAHARLLERVAVPSGAAGSDRDWSWTLLPHGSDDADAGLAERVTADPEARRVSVRRETAKGASESEWRVVRREETTWLVREAFFTEPREDLLRNDSLRGRLAGSLSADLLAWARAI